MVWSYHITHDSPWQSRRCESQSKRSFLIDVGGKKVLVTQADIYIDSYLLEVRMEGKEVE